MKPRPDNVLANLPEAQLTQLHQWIDEHHTQAKIVALLAENFGVQTHNSSVGRYCERLAREARDLDASLSIESLANAQPEEFDQAAVAGLKHKLYKLATSNQENSLEFARLFRLRLRMKDQELARERFEYNVAEIALKHASALRDIANDSDLDTKEKRRAARLELFGVLTNQEEPITHDEKTQRDPNGPRVCAPSTTRSTTSPLPDPIPPKNQPTNLANEPESNCPVTPVPSPDPAEIPSENLRKSVKSVDKTSPSPRPPSCASRPAVKDPFAQDHSIGDAVIMKPESAPQSFSDSYFDNSVEETAYTPDGTRDYKVKTGKDYFGEYYQYEYRDGHNPQGDTKYVMDRNTFTLRRRKEQ